MVITTNEEEEVVDTTEVATIKVEEGIITKIPAKTTIEEVVATTEAVAMAASMKEAMEGETLTIKEAEVAEEAITNPSTMRVDMKLTNGETTIEVAKIAITVEADRAAINMKKVATTKEVEEMETLITTSRSPQVPHLLVHTEAIEVVKREEDTTTLSNSGNIASLKVLISQRKAMGNIKISETS